MTASVSLRLWRCSLAAGLPDLQQLPAARGELYERSYGGSSPGRTKPASAPTTQKLLAVAVDALLDILAPLFSWKPRVCCQTAPSHA